MTTPSVVRRKFEERIAVLNSLLHVAAGAAILAWPLHAPSWATGLWVMSNVRVRLFALRPPGRRRS
jgi:hypothetical protein